MPARRLLAVLALVAGLLLWSTPAQAGPRTDAEFVRVTNLSRTARGLRPLVVSPTLAELARLHSIRMSRAGRLYHDVSRGVRHWAWLGQNVGVGPLGADGLRLGAAAAPGVPELALPPGHHPGARGQPVRVGTWVTGRLIWVTADHLREPFDSAPTAMAPSARSVVGR